MNDDDIIYKIVKSRDKTKIELKLECTVPMDDDAFYGTLLSLVEEYKEEQLGFMQPTKSNFEQ